MVETMKIAASFDVIPYSLVDINISEISMFCPEDGGSRFLSEYGKCLFD
jgi:hypothetical protein